MQMLSTSEECGGAWLGSRFQHVNIPEIPINYLSIQWNQHSQLTLSNFAMPTVHLAVLLSLMFIAVHNMYFMFVCRAFDWSQEHCSHATEERPYCGSSSGQWIHSRVSLYQCNYGYETVSSVKYVSIIMGNDQTSSPVVLYCITMATVYSHDMFGIHERPC